PATPWCWTAATGCGAMASVCRSSSRCANGSTGLRPRRRVSMHLDLTPDEQRFREELADWLAENVPKEKPRHDDRFAIRDYDMAWQRTQYEGGWAGISWPKEYGGRGLSLVEQV